ncbi:DUF418 domain-containing protein [Sphingomonas immobilis]|uniref:DUF418 domain-containing protein n=1 Tax=Sphingomonas immobilis TaxID=3063997 RepID=A0ABT9A253_9SPHN|nr:DUF418 domain-containing protein [Sphingomonas sp. CA1-15]MDO7842797.1 DUF418 domain-containing protein [Sphingomonas sp. CA1-15]
MSDPATTTEPDGAPRIAVLDILRGVAILGILFMNFNDMGRSLWASSDDIRSLGWDAADRTIWFLREVLANGTARGMLEMLFGAGMVILTDKAMTTASFQKVMARYYWRNLILLLFGLVHLFVLLWPGDILHTYALAAMIAFLFSRLRAQDLFMFGLSLAAFTLVTGTSNYLGEAQYRADLTVVQAKQQSGAALGKEDRTLLAADADYRKRVIAADAAAKARIADEDRSRRGDSASWIMAQWRVALARETDPAAIGAIWEAAATMLIGAGLFRLGIVQGLRSRRFYWRLTLLAYAIGVTLRTTGAIETMHFDDAPKIGFAIGEVARLAMTLGHVGAVNLLLTTAFGARLLKPLAAAGRTALTLYILQSLIGLWLIFPPFALGLYGTLSWAPLMGMALVIDVLLLLAANLYLRYFDIAPVEWTWRSLVEGRALPWRKRAGVRREVGASRAA